MPDNRTHQIERNTAETKIRLRLAIDGTGKHAIHTGVGFLDHMLVLFSKHGQFDLDIQAVGDLHVDAHHTTEDVGICLGIAFREALGAKNGIRRYGHMILPMEETLVTSALDLSGRPYLVFSASMPSHKIGDFDSELIEDFWQAFVNHCACNLHVVLHHGRNTHHIAEAIFKGTARALRIACEFDARQEGIPSSKGVL